MSEYRAATVHALAQRQAVRHAAVEIEAMPDGAIYQLVATSDRTTAAQEMCAIASERGWDMRVAGPGQWFLVGGNPVSSAEARGFLDSLPPGIDAFDQSHGRARIKIHGPAAPQIVANGTFMDLAAFPVGSATTTLVGHVSTHLTRTSETSFEMLVLRVFAESLWDDLVRMTGEFA